MRTFYVAGSLGQAEEARRVSAKLEGEGMRNLFPWWEEATDNDLPREKLSRLADREVRAAFECDVFVMLACRSRGAHVELGAALASTLKRPQKRVVIFGKEAEVLKEPSGFYFHEKVEIRESV